MTNSTKASHADVSLSACHYGHVYYNYSLLYGRKAGNFTDRGKVKNMSECLRICCKDVSCKIALMLELNCYSVACYGKFCQTVPVKPFQFKPKIAHVIRRKGKSESGVRYALTKRIKWWRMKLQSNFNCICKMQVKCSWVLIWSPINIFEDKSQVLPGFRVY